jgi:BirA family biotin operon repressor/biotin-[acetyl-CoA-carboxylase] ligase
VSRGEPLAHGFRLLRLDEIASTNDLARRFAEEGEAAGLFVVAGRQTAGRGRLGRTWQSPPGNLYASLLLRPGGRTLAEASTLSLVTALALAETFEALSGGAVQPRVKWPNDVLIEGAKTAGILLEGAANAAGRCAWLVIGIGVNVAWAPPAAGMLYPVTYLTAHPGLAHLTAPGLLKGLVGPLHHRLDRWGEGGFAALREAWLARAHRLGETVELRLGGGAVRGRFLDVDADGALRLERSPGTVERFTAGEIVFG